VADEPVKTEQKQINGRINGKFAPGVSGNPKGGGRPKKPPELREAAEQSLKILQGMLNDPGTNDKLRADIAKWMYEQQFGRATQRIAGDGEESAIKIEMPDAIRELAK